MHVQVRVCMCIYTIYMYFLYIDVRFNLIICTKTKPQVYKLHSHHNTCELLYLYTGLLYLGVVLPLLQLVLSQYHTVCCNNYGSNQ